MEQEEVIATSSGESVASQKEAPQVSEPAPQGIEQKQEPEPSQVEPSVQPPASKTEERPKPSDFVSFRKVKKLESSVSQLNEQIKQIAEMQKQILSSSVNQQTPEENISLLDDPEKWSKKIQGEIEKLSGLKEDTLKALEQKEMEREYARRQQQALELIYPKQAGVNDTLEERYAKDPEKAESLMELSKKYPLVDEMYTKDPKGAFEILLKIQENEKLKNQTQTVKRNPLVPSKAQMSTPSSSGVSGGSKKMANPQELEAQFMKLTQELSANPALVRDQGFKQRYETLQTELAKIHQGV